MSLDTLRAALPPEQRLALAYAPKSAGQVMLGMLALDARLASVVRATREPVLGQLRLAWWREQLTTQASSYGDALLTLLHQTRIDRAALVDLVDGWEQFLCAEPLHGRAIAALAASRSRAMAAVAAQDVRSMQREGAAQAAYGWALADLAARIGEPSAKAEAVALATGHDWQRPCLAREMRPLVVLHGLARRRHDGRPLLSGVGALPCALRLGLLGF